jgi:plastocyanin
MTSRSSLTWLPFVAAALLFAVLLAGCTGAPSGQPPATTQPTPATTTAAITVVPTTTASATTIPATTVATPVQPVTTTAAPTTMVPPAPVAVTIQNFLFSPASVTVPRGTTVSWTNLDPSQHTVTSDVSGKFSSGILMTGQTFSFTFTETGSYPYHCGVHPTMHGTVIVT